MSGWVWPLPSGRRRPSVRIGLPWLAAFLGWLAIARAAVDHPALRTNDPNAWAAWLAVGGVFVPALVVIVSRLLDVHFQLKGIVWTAAVALLGSGVSLLVLFREFPAFAFLGGYAVSAMAAASYALATSQGLEASRDATGR